MRLALTLVLLALTGCTTVDNLMVSSVLQMAGLLILGVLMRQSHRDSLQLITSVGVLVYQETGKLSAQIGGRP